MPKITIQYGYTNNTFEVSYPVARSLEVLARRCCIPDRSKETPVLTFMDEFIANFGEEEKVNEKNNN
jgi:hypothetical protein